MKGDEAIMEPVPEVVRQSALQAFDLRVPDAVVADLVYDPLIESGHRGEPGSTRVLQFLTESGEGAAIEVSGTGPYRLDVSLTPSVAASVELRNTTDTWQLSANAKGSLSVESVPPGLISLVIRREGSRPIQTSWVRI
jgi:hypothetical protein